MSNERINREFGSLGEGPKGPFSRGFQALLRSYNLGSPIFCNLNVLLCRYLIVINSLNLCFQIDELQLQLRLTKIDLENAKKSKQETEDNNKKVKDELKVVFSYEL